MQYMVVMPDGTEYGPADVNSLAQWATEQRVLPTTSLRNVATGQVLPAAQVPGIFSASVPPQLGGYQAPPQQTNSPYPRGAAPQYAGDEPFPWKAALYPLAGIISFFALHG